MCQQESKETHGGGLSTPSFFLDEGSFPEVLPPEIFVKLFEKIGAQPRWGVSNGKNILQLLGLCHHSSSGSYSVIFDIEDQYKCHCFSACGATFYWWNYIARAMRISSHAAKEWIMDWLEDENIEIADKISLDHGAFEKKRFEIEHIDPIEPIPDNILKRLYSNFDSSLDTLNKLVWKKEDGIDSSILKLFDVAYYPENGSIILPHHNAEGGIVGLYERSFKPLRKDVKKSYSDIPYSRLLEYPRAKYVPLLKEEEYRTEKKVSWSFPNSRNLYGLHLAKNDIAKKKIAIVFEGAKSVMLSRQYGFPYAAATHTYGIHFNHINMLIEQGAEEIVLAFDKQYRNEEGNEWDLFEKRTKEIAKEVENFVKVSRVRDSGELIGYKDAPIDHGKEVFLKLYSMREPLNNYIPPNAKRPSTFAGMIKELETSIPEEERMNKHMMSQAINEYNEYFVI